MTYKKFIKITGNRYSIRTDTVQDFKTLFTNVADINTLFILVMEYNDLIYTIDIGKIIAYYPNLSYSNDINDFISKLNAEMIYTFRSEFFNNVRCVRTFMSHDLPGETVISPCNLTTGELSNTTYNPNYSDVVIWGTNYNLNNVIPIIGGKMRYPQWHNGKIYLEDRVDLVKSTQVINFISLADVGVEVLKLRDIKNSDWDIPPDKVPMIVLCGMFFYDIENIYHIDHSSNKLVLHDKNIIHYLSKANFTVMSDIIDDEDSFVILVDTKRVFVRDTSLIPVRRNDGINEFVYYEKMLQNNHVDYICIDNVTNEICGITVADDMYKNVVTDKSSNEHHVYVHGGSGNMRLVQLAFC